MTEGKGLLQTPTCQATTRMYPLGSAAHRSLVASGVFQRRILFKRVVRSYENTKSSGSAAKVGEVEDGACMLMRTGGMTKVSPYTERRLHLNYWRHKRAERDQGDNTQQCSTSYQE